MASLEYEVPSAEEITQDVIEKFGVTPCKFQVEATIAQLKQALENPTDYRRGVLCIAGTGSGKSLAFYMPFLFNDNGISIMVTPLNVLAEQMAHVSTKLGISVANLTGDSVAESLLRVSDILLQSH